MLFNLIKNTVLLFLITLPTSEINNTHKIKTSLLVGANQLELYLPILKNKSVAVVANQTSVIFKKSNTNYTHLVDSLLKHDVEIEKVFAPEHGYRGIADAGEYVNNGIDSKTGLQIISLYGSNKKPNKTHLEGIDIVIFDIQGVGARFYTYISTLHYMMEACAELKIKMIILDRPNPNAHYIDGPVLDMKYKSFVGMHPVPITHGMTIGEFATMINGEEWLGDQLSCDLTVIKIKNYNRNKKYELPIKPSPNLPNGKAINLYPSLCLFEGTNVSVGRGTEMQFQVFGSPLINEEKFSYSFTPQPNIGSKSPKHNGKVCYGLNLERSEYLNEINLEWLISAYQSSEKKSEFFNSFFTKIAGQKILQKQIENGFNAEEIKKSWKLDLKNFKTIRSKYTLYKD